MHERKQDLNLLLINVVPRLVDISDAVVDPEVDTNVLFGVPEKRQTRFQKRTLRVFDSTEIKSLTTMLPK